MAKIDLIPAATPPGLTRFEKRLVEELQRISEELRTTPECASMTERIVLLAIHRRVATDIRKSLRLHRWVTTQLVSRGFAGQLDLLQDIVSSD